MTVLMLIAVHYILKEQQLEHCDPKVQQKNVCINNICIVQSL